jgi:outer membrane protein assembly factor BamB
VDYASGEIRWKFETTGPVVAIPAVYKNLVFAAGGSGDGTIYAVDKDTHTLFWSFQTQGKVDSDPVIVGDRMYVTCTDRFLYVFKIHTTKAG